MSALEIQLSRRRGFRLPAGAIVVSRPSRYGNPFKPDEFRAHPSPERRVIEAVEAFRRHLIFDPRGRAIAEAARRELKGRSLACWCRVGRPCHRTVLLEAARGALLRNVHLPAVEPQRVRGDWTGTPYWVETRYSRRGWWSILWPWPESVALMCESGVTMPLRQDAGRTLPIYCRTKAEAVDWAWTLADMRGKTT